MGGLDDEKTLWLDGNRRPIISKNKRRKLRGKVQKVLRPIVPLEPEKAQISVEEADELYREIRVENILTDKNGDKVRLKLGAEVDVVLEADTDATTKQPDTLRKGGSGSSLG